MIKLYDKTLSTEQMLYRHMSFSTNIFLSLETSLVGTRIFQER